MPTPPGRRWFQFGLRTMFVVVAVAAVIAGWVAYEVRAAHRRIAARDHLERVGAIFNPNPREYQLDSFPSEGYYKVHAEGNTADWPPVTTPLQRFLGNHKVFIILFHRDLTPTDWELIKEFPEATVVQVPP